MHAEGGTQEMRPVAAGLFTLSARLGEPVQLIAVRCEACGAIHFPQRALCANCSSSALSQELLGPNGTLHSYTYQPDVRGDDPDGGPYVVGQVTFTQGVRVQGRLRRCTLDALVLDGPVRALLGAIGADGDATIVSYVFEQEAAS
jgi:uncharacterized OB-fold protein